MAMPVPVPRGHPAIKLLDRRATDHDSFITHIDRSPVYAKILIFQIPLWMNIIAGGLLAWRAMKGTTQYLMASILHGEFIMKPSLTSTSWTWIIVNGIIDYALYHFVWPSVRTFVTGHLWLRLRWGFRETEIVFRKPTGWRRALLNGLPREEFRRQYEDVLYQAIDLKLVSENTGYLTRSDHWALEYDAVGDAYFMMATGEVDIKTWDLSVWTRAGGEWQVWQVWRLHDEQTIGAIASRAVEKLRAMDKEDLIQQWQSTSLDPGAPFATLSNTVVDLFRREGVDFDKLWAEAANEAATGTTV